MNLGANIMSQNQTNSTRILVEDALLLIKSGQGILIDIREQEELESEGIARGALWIPMSKMTHSESALVKSLENLDANKKLILYCKSGGRVSRLIPILEQKKFSALNMGGLKDWIAAGQPIEKI